MQQSSTQIIKRHSQMDKTVRAFETYMVFLDTAQWLRNYMGAQLHMFDMTMGTFRLLELLYREGPMEVSTACRKRQADHGNMVFIINKLQRHGWVSREVVTLPPSSVKLSRLSKSKRGQKRVGRRVTIVRLTPQGEKVIAVILPKHAKVVKALLRVLDAREKESLVRLCLKLREGDVRKFVDEMSHPEVEDQDN